MAKGYNSCTFVGNLGKDPEGRYTPSGTAVTSFNIAVTTGKGEHEKTEWIRCNAWSKLGETVNEHLSKGDQVLVNGEISGQAFTKKDGSAGYSIELNVREIQFLKVAKWSGEQGSVPEQADSFAGAAAPAEEEDIPF